MLNMPKSASAYTAFWPALETSPWSCFCCCRIRQQLTCFLQLSTFIPKMFALKSQHCQKIGSCGPHISLKGKFQIWTTIFKSVSLQTTWHSSVEFRSMTSEDGVRTKIESEQYIMAFHTYASAAIEFIHTPLHTFTLCLKKSSPMFLTITRESIVKFSQYLAEILLRK